MQFTLNIKLGNAAMQTAAEISNALIEVAGRIDDRFGGGVVGPDTSSIRDANGNTVGTWTLAEPTSPLGDPPEELADAWERYQRGEHLHGYELRALDEWRADVAEDAGY